MLPVPGIAAHFLEAVLSFPSEFAFCFGRVGVTGGNVACSSRFDAIGDFDAIDFFEGLHQLKD